MIVSMTALIAATALAAPTQDEAPLDDLRVVEALAVAADAEGADEDADWLALQGYAGVELDAGAPGYDRRRRNHARRHGYGHGGRGGRYGAGRAGDGGVYGPRKDALRGRADRFGLGGGFVNMPGPRGAGGRIAADALEANDLAASEEQTQAEDVTVPETVTGDPSSTIETRDAQVLTERASAPAQLAGDAPALRLSFAKSYAPAVPAGDAEALPTPLPASFLLFASGMGLLGLSRRKLG